jgi:hypothetical protein
MALTSVTGENGAVAGLTALIPWISIHSATPGTTGTSEISGGSYARQAVTWASASSGSQASSDSQSFAIPATTTCAYFGGWSASTSGTYESGGALNTSVTFNTAGTLTMATGAISFSAS